MNNLNSVKWSEVKEAIRKCHLETLNEDQLDVTKWEKAFQALLEAIKDERMHNPSFAIELSQLTQDAAFEYDVKDILEEYFDVLEKKGAWQIIVDSCNQMIEDFEWETDSPSQYFYRKGNALMKLGKMQEAKDFGKEWMQLYPRDYYAYASNVFLLLELGEMQEAIQLTEKCLGHELVCDKASDTFFMAATRLLELTEDGDAKARVAEKLQEYEKMMKNRT